MVETRRAVAFVAGPVMLCAWCALYERPHAAARESAAGEWQAIPHEQARALHRSGTASHGICPWCRPRLAAEWEIPLSVFGPAPISSAAVPLTV